MTVNKVVSFLAIADNDSPAFENLKNDVNTLESKKQKMEKNLHNLEDEIASSKGYYELQYYLLRTQKQE